MNSSSCLWMLDRGEEETRRSMAGFWRRHRWTALRSLLLVALLHRLHFLAFLAASSPVWLLTAFLLGAVLVNSEPNVPLAGASEEDEDPHLYKTASGTSSDGNESSVTSMEAVQEVVNKAAVAWTADDEHSIQSIGSLELERDARLEKLMSSRTNQRSLIDLDVPVHQGTNNPFDHSDDHGAAAPSSLLVHHTNPFDIDIDIDIQHQQQREKDSEPDEEGTENDKEASFTAPLARPSRFKPYFVADVPVPVPEGGGVAGSDNSNSSSPSSSTASDRHTQPAVTVRAEEAPVAWDGKGSGMVMAVDVELISDSSDDDMSLQGDDATGGGTLNNHSDDDEEDSFEVESITQQVASGKQQLQPPRVAAVVEPMSPPSEQGHRHQRQQHEDDDKRDASIVSSGTDESTLASVEENQQRERELTEIREHHILGTVPIIDSSSTSASAGAPVGAAGAMVAAAPTPPAAAPAAGPPPAAPPPQPAAPPIPPAAAAAAGPPPIAAAAPTPRATAPVASAPPSGKLSSKSKVASKKIDPKKAVFGFFRK